MRAVESQLSTDQRAVSRTENQYRDQLNERNTLLLTVYQAVDKVAGADKVGFPCRLFLVLALTSRTRPRSERRRHRNRPNPFRTSPSFMTAFSSGSRPSTNCTCRSSVARKSSRSALSTSCSESPRASFLCRGDWTNRGQTPPEPSSGSKRAGTRRSTGSRLRSRWRSSRRSSGGSECSKRRSSSSRPR